MREVQQKPSWNEPGGGEGGDTATPGPSSEPEALRTVQTFIMIEHRRRADFSIDSILKYDWAPILPFKYRYMQTQSCLETKLRRSARVCSIRK